MVANETIPYFSKMSIDLQKFTVNKNYFIAEDIFFMFSAKIAYPLVGSFINT